jgi:hypothetical protein
MMLLRLVLQLDTFAPQVFSPLHNTHKERCRLFLKYPNPQTGDMAGFASFPILLSTVLPWVQSRGVNRTQLSNS